MILFHAIWKWKWVCAQDNVKSIEISLYSLFSDWFAVNWTRNRNQFLTSSKPNSQDCYLLLYFLFIFCLPRWLYRIFLLLLPCHLSCRLRTSTCIGPAFREGTVSVGVPNCVRAQNPSSITELCMYCTERGFRGHIYHHIYLNIYIYYSKCHHEPLGQGLWTKFQPRHNTATGGETRRRFFPEQRKLRKNLFSSWINKSY